MDRDVKKLVSLYLWMAYWKQLHGSLPHFEFYLECRTQLTHQRQTCCQRWKIGELAGASDAQRKSLEMKNWTEGSHFGHKLKQKLGLEMGVS